MILYYAIFFATFEFGGFAYSSRVVVVLRLRSHLGRMEVDYERADDDSYGDGDGSCSSDGEVVISSNTSREYLGTGSAHTAPLYIARRWGIMFLYACLSLDHPSVWLSVSLGLWTHDVLWNDMNFGFSFSVVGSSFRFCASVCRMFNRRCERLFGFLCVRMMM